MKLFIKKYSLFYNLIKFEITFYLFRGKTANINIINFKIYLF